VYNWRNCTPEYGEPMKRLRTPKQQRGIKTKQRIVKTALRLFARKGIHGTNSTEIAKKAGVSIGSFYSYFKNKRVLLLEVLEDYVEQHYRTIWKKLDDFDEDSLVREKIKTIVDSVFDAYDISPDFHRQTHALRYTDPDIKRIYDREREREVDRIRHLLEKNADSLKNITDSRAAAMVIHNAVENVAHTAKFMGSDIESERLADGLVDMICGFLLGSGPAGS